MQLLTVLGVGALVCKVDLFWLTDHLLLGIKQGDLGSEEKFDIIGALSLAQLSYFLWVTPLLERTFAQVIRSAIFFVQLVSKILHADGRCHGDELGSDEFFRHGATELDAEAEVAMAQILDSFQVQLDSAC